MFLTWRSRWETDGINVIEKKYTLKEASEEKMFTKFLVDIGKPPATQPFDESTPRESTYW